MLCPTSPRTAWCPAPSGVRHPEIRVLVPCGPQGRWEGDRAGTLAPGTLTRRLRAETATHHPQEAGVGSPLMLLSTVTMLIPECPAYLAPAFEAT